MKIEKATRFPTLSEQIYETLKKNILRKSFPGSKLPTEKELVQSFDVSRETIRSAVDRLVEESLLQRVQGKGTFVGSLPIDKTNVPIMNRSVGVLFYRDKNLLRDNSFYGSIFNAFLRKTTDSGYVPMLFSTFEHPDLNDRFFQMCRQGFFAGTAILSISYQDTIREVAETGVPSVLIDHWSEDGIMDSIEPESFNGAIDTVKELYKLGHRRIGYMAWSKYDLNPGRLDGYKAGLKEVGLPYDKSIVVESESVAGEIIPAARKLLSVKKRPSAVMCNAVGFGQHLINEAKSMGISVPSELSVAGFGGLEKTDIANIAANTKKMGTLAFKRLMERIKNPDMPYERIFVSSKLIRNQTIAFGPYKQKKEKIKV